MTITKSFIVLSGILGILGAPRATVVFDGERKPIPNKHTNSVAPVVAKSSSKLNRSALKASSHCPDCEASTCPSCCL